MRKLSKYYREDSVEDIEPDLLVYLEENYLKKLPNLDASNPKLLVVFSGGSGVGKSTLSRKISDELSGLVLENDAIKYLIMQYLIGIKREDLNKQTWNYSMYLYKHLSEITNNGLVVRDGVIDWYFDRIVPIFIQNDYELFIVAYDLSRKRREELLRKRGDKATVTAERLIEIMDDQDIHSARFRDHYKPDIILNDETAFNHELVIKSLHEKLNIY